MADDDALRRFLNADEATLTQPLWLVPPADRMALLTARRRRGLSAFLTDERIGDDVYR